MSTNDFLPFAGAATEILSQSDYAIDPERTAGNTPNTDARAQLVNKALRQGTAMAAALAGAVSEITDEDILDDGDVTTVKDSIVSAMTTSDPDAMSDATLNGSERVAVKQSGSWLRTTVTGIASFVRSTISRIQLEYDSLSTSNAAATTPSASAMTWTGGRAVKSVRNSTFDGTDVYRRIYPGVHHADALNGILEIPSGSTIEHGAAISGYVRGLDASPTNGVALFGCATAEVDGSYVWGINTLLQDSSDRMLGAGTGTGRGLINELDFNVMNPATQVIGLSAGGNSLAQPVAATAFNIAPLGSGIKWTAAFNSQDGACNNIGLSLGMMEQSGINVASQKLLLSSSDASGVKGNVEIQSGSGWISYSSTVAWNGIKINGGSLWLDATGGVVVNGEGIIGSRKTGWTASTGTTFRGTWDTETVTTTGLARVVHALLTDLRAHGLIGS